LASLALGYFAADTINGGIDKLNTVPVTATNTTGTRVGATLVTGAQLGVGGLLLLSKKKAGTMGMVKTVAGGVLAGAGIKRALKQAKIISGYQMVPAIGRRMGGYQNVPTIGGTRPAQLAGTPAQLAGYRVNGVPNGYVPNGSGTSKVMGAVDGPGAACGAGCMG